MPGKKSRFAYSLAAMAAVVALQAPVVATAETDNAQMQAERGDRNGKHDKSGHNRFSRDYKRDIAFMIPGYGPIGQKTLDALNLTDAQKQKIEAAQAEQKALRATHRSEMKSAMQARVKHLQEGKIDPRAAVESMQAVQEKMAQQRANVAGKWLEAWDALDNEQHTALVKALSTRHEHRKNKMQGRSSS